MKSWLIALTAVLLGLIVGAAASLGRIGFPGSGDPLDLSSLNVGRLSDLNLQASQDGPAKVVVSLIEDGKRRRDETTIDFGLMPVGSKASVEFIFRNEGEGVLQLRHRPEDSSCKCTVGHLADEAVEPGKETTVKLEWDTSEQVGPFRHHAAIHTNDPSYLLVKLVVVGEVTPGLAVYPDNLPFGRISSRDSKSLSFRVVAFRSGLLIESCQVLGSSDPQRLEISQQRMSKEQLDDFNKGAKSGYHVTLTLKPGLPFGAFQRKILVTTNLFDPREVPVSGTIVGDITVSKNSPGWIPQRQVLNLGSFASEAGSGNPKKLYLLVRGPQRNDIRIEVKQTSPQVIQATLGKPLTLKSLVRWPILVHILKGQPAMNHRRAGNYGKIVLETNHQDESEREMVIDVSFEVTP